MGAARLRTGIIAGYAAVVVGLVYAAFSLYWTLGGTALLDTAGGEVGDLARRGGTAAFALGLGATLLKVAGCGLCYLLVRTRGRVRWVLVPAALGGCLLIVYGGVLVAVGALVLTGAVEPDSAVDWTALRWHVAIWDLWFLVWGILLTTATVAFRRQSFVDVPASQG